MIQYAPYKTIPVPPFGRVDVSDCLPLVNSQPFQRLKYITQLSLVKEVFPGATHTRYTHSLGVMEITRRLLRSMVLRGFFSAKEAPQLERDISIAALVHDIGHPPYSHMVEYLLSSLCSESRYRDHNKRGEVIIQEEAASAIIASGSHPERILPLLRKKNDSLGKIITTKSIGADKLTYLFQDQHMTGYEAIRPLSIDAFLPYITFQENTVVAEEKAEDLLKSLQRFYFDMYTHVYLRKQCLAAGRLLQKALQFHIQQLGRDPQQIWQQPEGWIDTQLAESPLPAVQRIYQRIRHREALKVAVAFKLPEYLSSERIAGKDIAVRPFPAEEIGTFISRYTDPLALTDLEAKIAAAYHLPESDVIMTIVPDPRKLIPEDIPLVNSSGESRGSLFERLPRFHQGLVEESQAFFSMRIFVPEEHRQRVASSPAAIDGIIFPSEG